VKEGRKVFKKTDPEAVADQFKKLLRLLADEAD
jgi:hypothetical protein